MNHLTDSIYDANDKGPSNRPFSIGRRLFKGGGTQVSSTKVELPSYVEPYAQELMQRSGELSRQEIPQYQGQTYAGLNPYQSGAIQGVIDRGMAGSSLTDAAQNATQNIASGGGMYQSGQNPYMGENPYLDAMIAKQSGDIANAYATGTGAQTMAQFRNAGAFGGSAMAETQNMQNKTLADSIANASNQARMQNYQQSAQLAENGLNRDASNYWQGQANQLQAAGMAPQLANQDYTDLQAALNAGGMLQGDQQQQLNDAYNRWQNVVNAPYQQLDTLSSGITGATGKGISRTMIGNNPYASNTGAGILGGALTGAGLASSMGTSGYGTAAGAGLGALLGGLM
ncbi:hypothetical protein [Cupriavidus necator]|uniref:hypothetical protein n=1 Tax=Cupriavidus necator TaxID=106590 RepID=UPI00339DA0E6